jgi:hypothetical protein
MNNSLPRRGAEQSDTYWEEESQKKNHHKKARAE